MHYHSVILRAGPAEYAHRMAPDVAGYGAGRY
jgi:hypothetical protein